MRRCAENGIITLTILFSVAFLSLLFNYFKIASDPRFAEVAEEQTEITINVENGYGNIYDRNMNPLVNSETKFKAVAIPQALERESTALFAVDKSFFYEKYDIGSPFVFECTNQTPESEGLTVFEIPVRYQLDQIASHVIGYISQEKGVSGIEYAYDNILRDNFETNSVTYSADGYGRILVGDSKQVKKAEKIFSGVVTTLDSKIQKICENSGRKIEKGAIIVTEISTGDILALASFPDYSLYNLENEINNEKSPLINRALYSYSLGSIFKLVTACEAIQENYMGYFYNCHGSINVMNKEFRCHKLDGHGLQNLTEAIVNSCNTYFISLSNNFNIESFRNLAFTFGFGREIHLCSGMTASAGVLPTINELLIPAELANFSFGQGKLSATPLQVSQFTCAIANKGKMPILRLIKGITENGITVANEKKVQYAYTIDEEIAEKVCEMMKAVIYENKNSNAKPSKEIAAAKTSTAQTGRFDDNGTELCNAWITGFFPFQNPKYAITVLVEDGGYGNDVAAPIFKNIVDEIVEMEEKD